MRTWLALRPGFICQAFLDERHGGWEWGVHCTRCRPHAHPRSPLACRFSSAGAGGPTSAPGGRPHTLPSALQAMEALMKFHRRQFSRHHRALRRHGAA